ncbi:hypothetical protein RRG08_050546 [Elysia crispata]|uniref:Uncharacterized protein n=1 Tax=Elysia crispata TaxID=231223 RepID=A0AAE0Z6T0_9GAST|nr:hypothetical protein RRG08_050546 [Elysia crispata]
MEQSELIVPWDKHLVMDICLTLCASTRECEREYFSTRNSYRGFCFIHEPTISLALLVQQQKQQQLSVWHKKTRTRPPALSHTYTLQAITYPNSAYSSSQTMSSSDQHSPHIFT